MQTAVPFDELLQRIHAVYTENGYVVIEGREGSGMASIIFTRDAEQDIPSVLLQHPELCMSDAACGVVADMFKNVQGLEDVYSGLRSAARTETMRGVSSDHALQLAKAKFLMKNHHLAAPAHVDIDRDVLDMAAALRNGEVYVHTGIPRAFVIPVGRWHKNQHSIGPAWIVDELGQKKEGSFPRAAFVARKNFQNLEYFPGWCTRLESLHGVTYFGDAHGTEDVRHSLAQFINAELQGIALGAVQKPNSEAEWTRILRLLDAPAQTADETNWKDVATDLAEALATATEQIKKVKSLFNDIVIQDVLDEAEAATMTYHAAGSVAENQTVTYTENTLP